MNKKGWGRGWHLKKHFEAPDGKVYSYGEEVKSAKKKSAGPRKKSTKKQKEKAAGKRKVASKRPDTQVAEKKEKGKLVLKKLSVWQVVYEVDGKVVERVSDVKYSKKEADEYFQRQIQRYGEDLAGAPYMILRNVDSKRKRKGWVVVEVDGTRHEFENTGKKEAKSLFLRKIKETRMPRGTKVEKIL